jgi:hypothetical protein
MQVKAHAELVDDIRKAWETRAAKINSFQYVCDLEFTKLVAMAGGTDHFGRPVDKNAGVMPLVFRTEFTFNMADGKFSYSNIGESWNEKEGKRVAATDRLCFDGADERDFALIEGNYWPRGTITTQCPIDNATIGRMTLAVPMWLAYAPQLWLTRQGYQVDQLKVIDVGGMQQERRCIKLSMPRTGGLWTGFVYVDPERNYQLLRFVGESGGKVRSDYQIIYADHERDGTIISKWVNNYFDNSGEVFQAFAGTVKRASVNEPLDEALFKLEFPVGTQVIV